MKRQQLWRGEKRNQEKKKSRLSCFFRMFGFISFPSHHNFITSFHVGYLSAAICAKLPNEEKEEKIPSKRYMEMNSIAQLRHAMRALAHLKFRPANPSKRRKRSSNNHLDERLDHNRPSAREIQLIPSEQELLVRVVARVDVVVVNDWRTLLRVEHDSLAARRVNIIMASQNQRPAILGKTIPTLLVDKPAIRSGRAADHDFILIARGREVGRRVAASTGREEEVVKISPLELVAAFHGAAAGGILGEVGGAAGDAEGRVGHGDLEDVVPVGAEGEEGHGVGVVLEEVAVDAVVGGAGGDADAAVVGPGAGVHGLGGGDSDVRVLGADYADGVVHVVGTSHVEDVRRLREVTC